MVEGEEQTIEAFRFSRKKIPGSSVASLRNTVSCNTISHEVDSEAAAYYGGASQ